MNLVYHGSVLAALDAMPPTDRDRIRARLERIASSGADLRVHPDLRALTFGATLFELRVAPDYRVLLRPQGADLVVLNIARKSYS